MLIVPAAVEAITRFGSHQAAGKQQPTLFI
jgi:hypothetical protein